MASIDTRRQQDGSVSFRARITLRGYPRMSRTFTRKTDAKRWAQQTETKIREGRHFPHREATQKTVTDLVDRYLAGHEARIGPRRANQLRWWRDRLGVYALAQITPPMIAELRDSLANGETPSAKPAGPSTVNRYLAALSHAFTLAVREWEWVDANPVRKVTRATEPRGRVRFLDDGERGRLLDACEHSRNPRLYALVLLALATGARQGELLGLRWRDVDLERGHATFHHTKNGSRRGVPITGPALELLRTMGKGQRPDAFVLAGRNGRAIFPGPRSNTR